MNPKAGNVSDIKKATVSFLPRRIAENKKQKDYEILDSIVFCADISGFTALTEKLASSGKEGPEEVTKIINSFFNPIVKIIDDRKGDIFFFGGDAITAIFESNDYENALTASEEIVDFVKKNKEVKTSRGVFEIKVHIGITKGKIFFKKTHANFIISGQKCYDVAYLLDNAKPMDIITDSSVKNIVSDKKRFSVVKKDVYKYKILNDAKKKRHEIKVRKSKSKENDLKSLNFYIPDWLKRRIQVKQSFDQKDGEHRKAAVLFIHFTNIPFNRDPEKASVLTNLLFERMNALQEKYGAWINKIDFYKDGLRALAVFGFPTKLENDERHAILFARELAGSRNLKETEMRMGINSGLLFGTPIGSNIRREYTVMGDTVNTAARIAANAEEGSITVSENVFLKTRGFFKFKKLAARKYKGKEKKISSYSLAEDESLAENQSKITKWISESSDIIGHKKEIKDFTEILVDAKERKTRIIGIKGEAGLGKSRLIKELSAIAAKEKFTLCEGNCISFGKTLSYYPWIEIINKMIKIKKTDGKNERREKARDFLNNVNRENEEWLPLFGEITGIDFGMNDTVRNLDGKLKKQKFFDIVVEALKHSSKKESLMIVMEDLHWIDSVSLELLNYVIRKIKDDKIVFLLAYRNIFEKTEFMENGCFTEWRLKELNEKETLQLVENLLNIKKLDGGLKSLVIKKSQGNPFYVEEIVKSLIEQGFITESKSRGWQFAGSINEIVLPDSIEGVILSRIDRLDIRERDIIQTASVIGREFKEDILKGIYNDPDLIDKSVGMLESLDLIKRQDEKDSSFFFKHILTCETAYNTLSYERKQEVHGNIGKYIEETHKSETDDFLEMLSYHCFFAKNYEKSLLYSVKAGDKAKNVFANNEAVEYFTRAIDSYKTIKRKKANDILMMTALHGRAEVRNISGMPDMGLKDLKLAESIAKENNDKKWEADIKMTICISYEMMSMYEEMKKNAEESVAIYESIDEKVGLANAINSVGMTMGLRGLYDEEMILLEKSRSILIPIYNDGAENTEVAIKAGAALSYVLNNIGYINRIKKNNEEAINNYLEALKIRRHIIDKSGEAQSLNNIGMFYGRLGDIKTSLSYFDEALKIYNYIGEKKGYSSVTLNMGHLHKKMGDRKKALKCFLEALKIQREVKDRYGESYALNNLGNFYMDDKEYSKARNVLEKSLKIRKEIKSVDSMGRTLFNLGIVYRALNEFDKSFVYLIQALDFAKAQNQKEEMVNVLEYIVKLDKSAGYNFDSEVYQRMLAEVKEENSE